jgi:hypothetical protein
MAEKHNKIVLTIKQRLDLIDKLENEESVKKLSRGY